MNTIGLRETASRFDFAKQELAEAVNRDWPVGTRVNVRRGRGIMRGKIVVGASMNSPEYVLVKGWKHKRSHCVHWRDLREAECPPV